MKGTLTGRCASCREHHPSDSMCPSHEVRTTGQMWIHVYLDELEAKVDELRAELDDVQGATQVAVVDPLKAEIKRLQVIVDKLPKCWRLDDDGKLVQDVPVVPGMRVWINKGTRFCEGPGILSESRSMWTVRYVGTITIAIVLKDLSAYVRVSDCYSTREAAEAAKGER